MRILLLTATLVATYGLMTNTAHAAEPVQFTAELGGKAPYQIKFHAPAKHHFNQEAPPKVELQNDGASETAKIEKTLPVMTATFAAATKLAANCTVKANLFVCDDANTFCRPVKEEFDCQKLQLKN